jgi:choline dehydrogenase-like flavoprotein
VYTASLGNAAAFLPLNEITNTSSTVVSKLQSQNPQDVFPAGTDPSVIAGWEAERDLIIKYTEEGKIAAGEFIGGPTVAMYLVLVKPFSRGSININTTDPFADPVVDFGTLRNPLDLDILVEMIRAWREMLLTPALQTMGPTATNPPDNMTSTADLQDFVRANLQSSLWHPTGTAAMMKKELGGVVGPDLLVYGTKKLSIIDASILPILPSTHITSTMYAVAEKVGICLRILLPSAYLPPPKP